METGGWANWTMSILERVANPADLQDKEQSWIDKLKPSLNMRNAKKKPVVNEFIT